MKVAEYSLENGASTSRMDIVYLTGARALIWSLSDRAVAPSLNITKKEIERAP